MTRYLSSRSLRFVTEKKNDAPIPNSPIENYPAFTPEQAETWARIAPSLVAMTEGKPSVIYDSPEEAIEDLIDLLRRISTPKDLIPDNIILALIELEALRVAQGGWRAEEREVQTLLLKMFDALFYGDKGTALHLTSKCFNLMSMSLSK
jgi:hypothetical protein